ncbi:hypothetical protein GCK32_014895 [Trichostrongylus colubriformis]|uniref:Uncharacterized protein n=1 Tax=Trichostrongylus colubriformis TaxID=6319 RepID=A0AAN8EXX1_TRICO
MLTFRKAPKAAQTEVTIRKYHSKLRSSQTRDGYPSFSLRLITT